MGVEITIIENGPAIIQNTEEFNGTSVNGELVGKKIALCRCRLSETKIFCDGSHKQIEKIKNKE